MEKNVSYKGTIIASYIGNFVHAIVINLTPIIFIPLREAYGFSYSQFGLLIFINFITQVIVDISFSKAVDIYGFRPFIIIAHILCFMGFGLFMLTPILFVGNEYLGFVIASIIFSGAGGFLELLLSPIIDAIPSKAKEKAMALLHSFYAWGQVTIVSVTTLCLFFGIKWQYIICGWMLLPLCNTVLFACVPLAQKVREEKVMKIRHLIKNTVFITAFFAIITGGAAEVTMAQWTSSFMQKGLALPKVAGDILGLCGFAIFLGIGRLIYGIVGDKLNLHKVLIMGSFAAALCYVVVALSPSHVVSIAACIITGICVSLLWPGTLVIASKKLPLAGASLFALLAAGGDIGSSVGPALTGLFTDFVMQEPALQTLQNTFALSQEQIALRAGILLSALYPLSAGFFHIILRDKKALKKIPVT